jgi:hypothetical protein
MAIRRSRSDISLNFSVKLPRSTPLPHRSNHQDTRLRQRRTSESFTFDESRIQSRRLIEFNWLPGSHSDLDPKRDIATVS